MDVLAVLEQFWKCDVLVPVLVHVSELLKIDVLGHPHLNVIFSSSDVLVLDVPFCGAVIHIGPTESEQMRPIRGPLVTIIEKY